MHHGLLAAVASVGPAVALGVVLISAILFGCGKKKKKNEEKGGGGTKDNNIRAPAKDGVAGTYDPNYQTLNAVGPGDCFGADKANAPKAPANQNGVAGTYDPNYQTLNAVGPGDCFNKNAPPPGSSPGPGSPGPGSPAPTPTPPAVGGIAGTHDPNYQTLAGVGGDCFGADKARPGGGSPAPGGGGGGAVGPPKPPAQGGIAGTHDPNYQTLAGMDGNVFDKK